MMELRNYQSSDLSELARVWNECFGCEPNFVRVDEADLRRRVTDQPEFDPAGILVAARGDQVLGFIHLGPRRELRYHTTKRSIDPAEGHIYVLVAPRSDRPLTRDLLAAAVERLTEAGARRVLFGPSWVFGMQPFYNGIAGAYEIPGLSPSREELLEVAAEAGFAAVAEYATPELDLSDADHLTALRGEASCLWQRAREWGFRRLSRPFSSQLFPPRDVVEIARGGDTIALTAYGLWPEYAREYGRRVFGITNVQVAPGWRGRGLGKLVVIEAMEAALKAGAEALHLHVWRDNVPAWNLYHRALGFRPEFTWVTLGKSLD